MKEAKEGATIKVVDPSGNIVEVSPLNLEIGDTEVIFNFKTAYAAGKLPLGVFTVEGKSFDTAAVAAVADVNAAGNVVELWEALQSTYFTGAIQANITAYDTALDGTQETVAEVQTIIDEVNAASVSDEQEAAIVKKVADATNVLQLLNAIQDPAFVRVNADWITDYSTENVTLDDATTATMLALAAANYFGETAGATIEGIQDAIDAENVVKAGTAVGAAEGTIVLKDVTDARALVNAYVPADVEGQPAVKQPLLDRLALHEAVVNVTLANTNAKLNSALNTLAGLSAALDITTVNPNELTRYRTDITNALAGDKDTAGEIQTLINTANTNAEGAAVTAVAAITAQTTPAQLKTLLTTLSDRSSFVASAFDIDTVVDALLEDYRADIVAAAAGDKDAASEIQTIITNANSDTAALTTLVDAGGALDDADKLLTALKDKTLNLTVVDANKAAYFADIADIKTAAGTDADAVQEVINATNARLELNKATTKEAARTALTKFAIATADTTYVNLSSTGKLEVAALVLAERPAAGYADNADVTSEILTQDAARVTLISNVNSSNAINTMNTALTALDYKAYDDLSAPQKVAVAEAFLANFPADKDNVRVNYTTITAIQNDIDKAITAVAQ